LSHQVGIADEVNIAATMSAVVQKSIVVAARGYRQASERLAQAVPAAGDDPDEAFIALVETINWLAILAEQTNLSSDVHVQAVLFARARGHHHMASIAYFDETRGTVVWRPATQLPVPENPRHADAKREAFYSGHLSQQPVLDVFRRLERIVTTALAPSTRGS
jgi:hypothetical protein